MLFYTDLASETSWGGSFDQPLPKHQESLKTQLDPAPAGIGISFSSPTAAQKASAAL
jgi:hypothetical protein